MPDQIPHRRLTSLAVRRKAYELAALISKVLDGEPMTPTLIALVQVLYVFTTERDLDAEAVVSQLLEAIERDDVTCDPEEVADIDERLFVKH